MISKIATRFVKWRNERKYPSKYYMYETTPVAKWLARSPREREVLGSIPGAGSYSDLKRVLSATLPTPGIIELDRGS